MNRNSIPAYYSPRHHESSGLIALTGYGQSADADAAREAGFDAHCTKPVTVAVLLDRIASLDSTESLL